MALEPLILTLELDAKSFELLNALRKKYFPPQRNVLEAHVTLFHKLPGEELSVIEKTLHNFCLEQVTLELYLPEVRFLGKGVAVNIESPGLLTMRKNLATLWHDWLSAQDLQVYKPHVTVQNKVMPSEARELFETLSATWTPMNAQGKGLTLWRYLGGPWEQVETFPFVNR
jgi:2'-5' RNA ligase superfamily